jgi:hypothetical protein
MAGYVQGNPMIRTGVVERRSMHGEGTEALGRHQRYDYQIIRSHPVTGKARKDTRGSERRVK